MAEHCTSCRRRLTDADAPGQEPPEGSLAHAVWKEREAGRCRRCAAMRAMPDLAERLEPSPYDRDDYDRRWDR